MWQYSNKRKLTNINDADTWDDILYMEEPTFNLHEDLPESEAIELYRRKNHFGKEYT